MVLLLVSKLPVLEFVGMIKSMTDIQVLHCFKRLRSKPSLGNHFWIKGYCVATVGLDME